jgi:hypothetical protein
MRLAISLFLLVTALGCQAAMNGQQASASGAPECKMGSDGQNTCGYNCKLGSAGHWYCASTPQGQCALNSNGTWTCP